MDAFKLRGTVDVDTTAAERGLQTLGKQVVSFGDSVKQGLGIATGIAAFQTGVELLTRGFGALKGATVDFNQTLDGASASMSRFFKTTNDLNNSMAFLNDLAARTPFAFEGLLVAQQRTIGAARSAQELKDNMDAIAVASANTGRVSTANMDRISLALGQMQAKGHLAGGEMLQLTEAGVNMGEILAKHFGVSTAAIQKMVTEGKIGSQDVFEALRENAADPRNREALDKMAKTWEGAWSTIGDVWRTDIAAAFRPLFDMMTEGAVALADFLQTDDFKTWAEALREGFVGISEMVKGLMADLGPLGKAIQTAFTQATQGDFSGAFSTLSNGITAQLGVIWDSVTSFASQMLGAGENVVKSFADGMISGGFAAITAAIDTITTFIADMLIGHSPPKSGPLSELDTGGANAAMAWAGPFDQVMQKSVGSTVDAIAQTISGLKDQSRNVAGSIREITDQIQDLDRTISAVKDKISTIKGAFAENTEAVKESAEQTKQRYALAIDDIKTQIDTIKDAHEKATRDVQRQIDDVKDKYGASIDEIKGKIESIKNSYDDQETAIQRQIDLLKDKYGDQLDRIHDKITKIKDAETDQLDPLQRQLKALQDANKYTRERQDAENAIADAKRQQLQLQALGDPKLRAELSGQLAGLDAQQQKLDVAQDLVDAQAKLASVDLTPLERQSLELKIQQLVIQQKLADMVDVQKVAESAKADAISTAQDKQLQTTRAIEDANNRIAEIPIEKKIQAIQDSADKALRPLNDQLHEIEQSQKTALEPLTDKLRGLKAEEQDALVPLQRRLKEIESDQKNALDPLQHRLKDIKADQETLLEPLETRLKNVQVEAKNADAVFDAMLSALKKQQEDVLKPLEAQTKEYQKQKDALTEQKQELERIKAEIQEAISIQQEAERNAKKAPGAEVPGAPKGGISFDLDAAAKAQADKVKAAGENLAKSLSEGFQTWWDANKTTIAERVVGALVGGILGGPLGAAAGAAFLPAFIDSLNAKLKERGFDAQPFIDSLAAAAVSGDYSKVAEEIAYGTVRAMLRIPGAVSDAVWKTFYEIMFKPSAESDKGSNTVAQGIVNGLIKGIKDGSGDILKALVNAIFPINMVQALLNRLKQVAIEDATKQIADRLRAQGVVVGDDLLNGIKQGVTEKANKITDAIKDGFGIIPFLKRLWGISSPSTVMAGIGNDLIQGLIDGVTKRGDEFIAWWTDLPDKIQTAFGWDGKRLTWYEDIKSAGSGMLSAMWDGLDAYWQSDFSQWWTDLPDQIKTTFGWDGTSFKWVQDLNDMGSKLLESIWDGLNSYWPQFSQWWNDLPGQIQSAFGWQDGSLGWIEDLKSIGSSMLGGIKSGLDSFWEDTLSPWWGQFQSAIYVAMGLPADFSASSTLDWLTGVGSALIGGLKQGMANALEGAGGFWAWLQDEVINQIPESIRKILHLDQDTGEMAKVGERMVEELKIGIKNRWPSLSNLWASLGATLGSGDGAIGDAAGWLKTAIQITGVGDDWFGGLKWLAEHESGGQADPPHNNDARGLMQTMPGTFDHYRDHDLPDDILNPISNAVAAIRYIQDTYTDNGRSLDWIISHWEERGGYAKGGIAWGPQVANLAENEPEVIIPKSWFAHQAGMSLRSDNSGMETHRFMIAGPSGQTLAEWYVTGREMAVKTGRISSESNV